MRRLRIFLREFRRIDARVGIPQGQSLTNFLAGRRSYLNLVDAEWSGEEDASPHAVVKTEQVLWVSAPDEDVPLLGSSAAVGRRVEVRVDGALIVRGTLPMGDGQRLSDYLEAQGAFVPLQDATLLRSGRPPRGVNVVLGQIALNQDAIHTIREVAALDEPVPIGVHVRRPV